MCAQKSGVYLTPASDAKPVFPGQETAGEPAETQLTETPEIIQASICLSVRRPPTDYKTERIPPESRCRSGASGVECQTGDNDMPDPFISRCVYIIVQSVKLHKVRRILTKTFHALARNVSVRKSLHP